MGYVNLLRALAIGLTALIATASVLALLSSQQVATRQQSVVDARQPVEPSVVDEHAPRLLAATYVNHWSARTVQRVVIAGGEKFPQNHPPGIPRNPRPGEAFVSQSVLDQVTDIPGLSATLANSNVVGTIDRSGLVSPGELRIIQGVSEQDAGQAAMTTVASFGDDRASPRRVSLGGPLVFFLPLLLCVTFIPLGFALVLATRLLGPETDRRFALLQAIGVRRSTCRRLAAAEVLPAAVAGASIAFALFQMVWRRSEGIVGTNFSFWAPDTTLPTGVALVVPVLIVALIIAVSSGSALGGRTRSTRPSRREITPRWWWIAPWASGLALLLYVVIAVPAESESSKQFTVAALGILMVGLPPVLSVVLSWVTDGLAHRAGSPVSLIGSRWAGNRQATSFKLSMALAVIVLTLSSTAPFIAALKGDTTLADDGLAAADGYNLVVSNASLPPATIKELAPGRTIIPVLEGQDASGNPVTIVVASCRELREVVRTSGCRAVSQWLDTRSQDLSRLTVTSPVTLDGGEELQVSEPEGQLHVPLGPSFQGALKVPPSALPSDAELGGSGLIVNLPDASLSRERFEGSLAAVSPTALSGNDYTQLIRQADSFSSYIEFLRLGLIAGLAGVLVALGAAVVRGVRECQTSARRVIALGASERQQRRAVMLAQGLPVFVCTLFSTLTSLQVWVALSLIYPDSVVPLYVYPAVLVVPVVLTAAVIVVSIPAIRMPSSSVGRCQGPVGTAQGRPVNDG